MKKWRKFLLHILIDYIFFFHIAKSVFKKTCIKIVFKFLTTLYERRNFKLSKYATKQNFIKNSISVQFQSDFSQLKKCIIEKKVFKTFIQNYFPFEFKFLFVTIEKIEQLD